MRAGLYLMKKKGRHELHKGVSYAGGKKQISYTEVIRRPHHSTNIVRDISPTSAQKKFGVKIKRRKRQRREFNPFKAFSGGGW